MSNGDDSSSVEVKTGFGSVALNSKKMAETILVMMAIAFGIGAFVLWTHATDSKAEQVELKQFLSTMADNNQKALREAADANQRVIQSLVEVQKQANEVQRETNCLISLPQEERRKEFLGENSFCKRMSRR